MIIEIDRDKNSIDQVNDDNNIVEEYELIENMLLYHQQIMKNAKRRQKHCLRRFNRINYII